MTPEDKKLLDRILSRAEEEGDCLIWRGYSRNRGMTPLLKVNGQCRTVRPVLAALWGLPQKEDGRVWVASCGVAGCIKKQHLEHLTTTEHAKRAQQMLVNGPSEKIRKAKISAAMKKFSKLGPEELNRMINYPASCVKTAEVFGVNKYMVWKHRNRSAATGVFAGLGAR